jgi:hypothetical protein
MKNAGNAKFFVLKISLPTLAKPRRGDMILARLAFAVKNPEGVT